MDQYIQQAISELHHAPWQAGFVVSGGGSQGLGWLLGVPGASNTVLEAQIPYSASAMQTYLGFEPRQFVCRETAIALANAAYRRARLLAGGAACGIACTAALVTDRPRRGAHHGYVALRDTQGITLHTLRLIKATRDRAGEEAVVSRLLLATCLHAAGIGVTIPLNLLDGEQVETTRYISPDPLLQLLASAIPAVIAEPDGDIHTSLPGDVALLSGSFNPLHVGHLHLAHVARQILGRPVCFELSTHNVDKPPLAESEVRRRLAQFAGVARGRVALTAAPLFEHKARLFPGSVFVIGYDTAVRLVDARYYGDDPVAMRTSLAAMRGLGAQFLVAGREQANTFRTLADVAVPPGYETLFMAVPPELFRVDISSTALRQAQEKE